MKCNKHRQKVFGFHSEEMKFVKNGDCKKIDPKNTSNSKQNGDAAHVGEHNVFSFSYCAAFNWHDPQLPICINCK